VLCQHVISSAGAVLSLPLTVLLGIGRIAKDADFYGSGFIDENNRPRGKNASCVIKTQKQDGDVLHLVRLCANDVTLGTVRFSLMIHDDDQITRIFAGVSDLDTKYYRCSP
jgi:hypothetical protein